MKLLLDTHSFLWHADGSKKMSAKATALLIDPANELFLSMASIWEVAIKSGLNKLTLSSPFAAFISKAIAGYGLGVLPITLDDCAEYGTLPFPLANHRDPFDRLIIVQAKRNGLQIVGSDLSFDAYGVARHW